MRLATFNIYWLGGNQIQRTEDDLGKIAQVIAKLDADVLAFQEIVGVAQLQTILDQANGLTAARLPIVRCESEAAGCGEIWGPEGRRHVRRAALRAGGRSADLRRRERPRVWVTLERHSRRRAGPGGRGAPQNRGQPSFTDQNSATTRALQCQHLADWVTGKKAADKEVIPAPLPDEHVVILGDFNALYRSDNSEYDGVVRSLDPLRKGPMAEWWWQGPLADPAGGDRTTVYVPLCPSTT